MYTSLYETNCVCIAQNALPSRPYPYHSYSHSLCNSNLSLQPPLPPLSRPRRLTLTAFFCRLPLSFLPGPWQWMKKRRSARGVCSDNKFRISTSLLSLFSALLMASSSSSSSSSSALLVLCLVACAALPPSFSDPNDEACLTHLSQSLEDPNRALRNWTKSTFSDPCNGFTSYLQGATCNNGRIYKLSLNALSLRGSISPFLANCTNLQALDLSSNFLTGPVPSDLQYLVNLAVLNLSSNRLEGQIPPELAFCAYLNVIDLHDNQLSGQIPQQLGLLVRLSSFDVSNNRLSGAIPESIGNRSGSLPRFNATAFEGNKDLYGYPLPEMKSKGLSVLAIVGIGLGSGFLSLVLSFAGVCMWLRFTERKMEVEEGKNSQYMPEY